MRVTLMKRLVASVLRNSGILSASMSRVILNCTTSKRLLEMRLVGVWAEPSGRARVGSGRPPVTGGVAGVSEAASTPRPPTPIPTGWLASAATPGGKKSSGIVSASRFLMGESVTVLELALTSLMAIATSLVIQNATCDHQIDSRLGELPSAGSDADTRITASGSMYILFLVAISFFIS